ncbi:hypothetical protein D9757_006424 [Collybiopsis confluens]|uniref:CUE domain-containing protein n=1 Tax=Collybiopsis confluens TaxID=2823264 RepID=A0A8H5M8E1_9AGAR|nr:hypothetical protein D9757_006424 [Collybiopsis confluens]
MSSSSRSSSPTKGTSVSPTKIPASGAPPRGPRALGQSHASEQAFKELAQSMDTLELNGNSPRRVQPLANAHDRYRSEDHDIYAPRHQHTNSAPGQFVGGFNSTSAYPPPPPGQYSAAQVIGPGPLPRPPQFPTAVVDTSLTMQYASHGQPPPPSNKHLFMPYGSQAGFGTPPSRPYSAPGPPGFPHPNTSPYPGPSPLSTPGSSPAHTPAASVPSSYPIPPHYPSQQAPPPAASAPNSFPPPNPYPSSNPKPGGGRPLPTPSLSGTNGNGFGFGALPQPQHLPSSPTRPFLTTQFNSPSAGPIKQNKQQRRPRATSTPPTPITSNSVVTGVSGQIQCSGVTKAGKRCTRMVKGGPALVSVWGPGVAAAPDSCVNTNAAGSVERFCHQHAKELLTPSGFYARRQVRDGQGRRGLQEWIDFADYIPPYLHPDTQVALRVEMEKPRSQSDVEGFIYSFEIRDPKNPSPPTLSLKIGRAVNVVKRLNQWGKQCGSKEQVLRGWYPGEVDPDSDDTDDPTFVGQSMMKGRVMAGGKGVWCHRLERLIHLELADLAVHMPYLQSGWEAFTKGEGCGKRYAYAHPELDAPAAAVKGVGKNPAASNSVIVISSDSESDSEDSMGSSPSAFTTPVKGNGKVNKSKSPSKTPVNSPAKSKKDRFLANGLGNGGGGEPCKDCGQIHKEIFEFARVPKGPKGKKVGVGRSAKKHVDYYGMEWEGIVKKVIEDWGEFVANYVCPSLISLPTIPLPNPTSQHRMGEVVNVIVAFAVIVLIFRWATSSSSANGNNAAPSPADTLGFRPKNVTQDMVDTVGNMFPDLPRDNIRYDLLRTGSVETTTNKILERGFLEAASSFCFPPASYFTLYPRTVHPAQQNQRNNAAGSSASASGVQSKETLISRYNLQSKAELQNSGEQSAAMIEEEEVGGKAKWEDTPEKREASLKERKEKMILAARQRMLAAQQEKGKEKATNA